MRSRRLPLFACTLVLLGRALTAQQAGPPLDLAQWEPAIRAFEDADRADPPRPGGILFIGSSSIRLWTTLDQDFPGLPVLNRGFGGSQTREVTAFVPRIVLPYKPALIVFYCGTNDIASGHRKAAEVAADFQAFVSAVRTSLPSTRIAFISAAPNPARWHLREEMQDLNRRVRDMSRTAERIDFIDVWPAMLGPDGSPRSGIYRDDKLHMNAAGYEIWKGIVGEYLRAHWSPQVH
jgi:lysophospholipase L1-like esterase